MNIIAIDDELDSLLFFTSCLVDMNDVSINIFQSKYNEALNYVKTHKVDIAFLDIVMPEISGIELARKFIENDNNIKIVFTTGYVQNIDTIKEEFKANLLGFFYKPYDSMQMKKLIVKARGFTDIKVYFKMFPRFDLFVNDVLVDFKRSKAKELLALLVDHRGGEVTLEEAITKLWIDKDVDLAKRLYRDAISRLRMKLKEYGIEYIVNFNRARTSLNVEFVSCDYYDFLDKKNNDFNGEYLRPYEWAIDTENYLVSKNEKVK